MKFGDYIDDLIERVKIVDNDTNRAVAGRRINLTYTQVSNASNFNWAALKRYGEVVTTPNYTDGSVQVSLDGYTITGTGTTWTSSMEGRFFKVQGETHWHKIVRVESATSLIIQTPITRASASGLTYTIWRRFYYFSPEVRKILEFGSWIRNGTISPTCMRDLREGSVDISNAGEPEQFVFYGDSPFEYSYNTGTVAITKDTTLLEGSGTSWLSNVEPGDVLEIGDVEYRVKRVESDTRIRLLNAAKVSHAAGSAYTITRRNIVLFQLYFNPNSSYVLPYTYTKKAFDMVNEDEDEMELPSESFAEAVLTGAESKWERNKKDSSWTSIHNLFSSLVQDLKRSDSPLGYMKAQVKVSIPGRRGEFF